MTWVIEMTTSLGVFRLVKGKRSKLTRWTNIVRADNSRNYLKFNSKQEAQDHLNGLRTAIALSGERVDLNGAAVVPLKQ